MTDKTREVLAELVALDDMEFEAARLWMQSPKDSERAKELWGQCNDSRAAAWAAARAALAAEPMPEGYAEETKIQTRIAELVEKHGSLRALARAIDLDVGYLSRLASGEKDNPSPDVLAKLGLVAVTIYFPAAPTQAEQGEKPL